MNRFVSLIVILLFSSFSLIAKEGMWIPTLLGKNYEEMKQMGFKLSLDDIYQINNASMKDAVVIFGRGCTGELISNEGLLITNHHCGYDAIQKHSSVDQDYLTDGFWAESRVNELPNPRLTVRFLQYMEDVTDSVLCGTKNLNDQERSIMINENISKIKSFASDSGKYKTVVKPLFHGNEYYLYVYLEYSDVRLVGAPPSAIGKFGGDTDNWMWPRHTGDFSLFRIYADENNMPAEYSEDNVPYKPKKFFPISVKGVQPNDFTMIFGYPGTTTEYLPSYGVDLIMNQRDPNKVMLRDIKLRIMSSAMENDRKTRIQYATKYARLSNSWKRWKGEILGLKKLNAVKKKQKFESDFREWYQADDNLENKYSDVLNEFEKLYADLKPYAKAYDFYNEISYNGTEVFSLARLLLKTAKLLPELKKENAEEFMDAFKLEINSLFKDFNQEVDMEMFNDLLKVYKDEILYPYLPYEFYDFMAKNELVLKSKIYQKSVLQNRESLLEFLDKPNWIKKLNNDPVVKVYKILSDHFRQNISPLYTDLTDKITKQQKVFMAGIMEMNEDEMLYPDANFTLRVGYGKVEGYYPKDGVYYDYYTTIEGIIQKDNPEVYDYNIPQKFRDIYKEKDFEPYLADGEVPVCFIASNHTTGGNSGSPVVNANGELVGINFDRCWEGTMSDIMYDPDRCRNIVLDIRYALFIIDKLADADYLLNEMDIRSLN